MAQFIRGGVPREMNLDTVGELTPAEGEQITYMISGRSGPAHIGGNGDIYGESNPHLGGFNQVVSVSDDDFQALSDLQSSNAQVNGYFTTAAGITFNCFGKIANDGALELDNGTVSLEFRGKVEQQ